MTIHNTQTDNCSDRQPSVAQRKRRSNWLMLVPLALVALLTESAAQQVTVDVPQDLESARARISDIELLHAEFTFIRVKYGSTSNRRMTWATDYPDADVGLSQRLAEITTLNVDPNGLVLDLTDERLHDYPFIYIVEPGNLSLTDEEVIALRAYLTTGGFLMADDFWGDREWAHVAAEMTRVLPDIKPIDLRMTHPVFHNVFHFEEKPQVCSIGFANMMRAEGVTWERPDGKEVHYRAFVDSTGRMLAILCHNTDLGDGWERRDEDAWYAAEFSEKRALPMGVNIVIYALSQPVAIQLNTPAVNLEGKK